ncbi:MAG: hypothetical protein ACK537_01155, partial [Pseudomonadota bacterium]
MATRIAHLLGGLEYAGAIKFYDLARTTLETPTTLGWGFFCLIAPQAACCRGFVRKLADFAVWQSGLFSAAFRSL